jgi:protoporphyrinogen oxidase
MQSLVEAVRSRCAGVRVETGSRVSLVDSLAGGRVHVVTVEGELTFDHLVVSVPLGVLKASHQELFQPPLPPEKVEAIDRIGFGRVGKVFIRF